MSWVLKSIYLKRTFDLILNTFLTFVLLKRFLSNGKTEIIFSLVLFPILCQIAGFLGILWCLSLLACFFAPVSVIPTYVYPLVLYGFMVFFLINPTKTFYYKSRFWLLKLLVSPEICVPFLEWCIGHWLPPEWNQGWCIPQLQKAWFTSIIVCVSGAPDLGAKNTVWLVHLMLLSAASLTKAHVHFFPPEMEYEVSRSWSDFAN